MRLIHTKPPLKLQEFAENEIPKYAILSHRWEKDEISFQEMTKPDANTRKKAGYKKIERFCARALEDHLEYAWVDTCGINKESSAELSEVINSVFRWYQGAEICYAYLSDVHRDNIEQSAWFTRGWTLQELLAPREVLFLASDWSHLGDRNTLAGRIARATGIEKSILIGSSRIQDVSIAKRMSWASQRQTTRTEDIAYCLMGIFDVNMPLLYGEGQKAFIRLQEEIMKDSDDQTLFVWDNDEISEEQPSGLLARSPKDFQGSGDVVSFPFSEGGIPFALTNRGIRMHLPLLSPDRNTTILILECQKGSGVIGIDIMILPSQTRKDGWVRTGKSFKRNMSLNLLPGAFLDTIYILKTAVKSAESLPSPGTMERRAPKYAVHPRGHHRKLVICFDVNRDKPTYEGSLSSVGRIYRILDKNETRQMCYFHGGSFKTAQRDFAIGGYNFLMEHHKSGDEILIFGFSNGAHAVHILVNMISLFGVLAIRHKHRIASLWKNYDRYYEAFNEAKDDPEMQLMNLPDASILAKDSAESYCSPSRPVLFVGLFDTVDSHAPRAATSSRNMDLAATVVRHAVAIDEVQTELSPILVQATKHLVPQIDEQDFQEVWFPGTHVDLGSIGKYWKGGLSILPLVWILTEALKSGLHLADRQDEVFSRFVERLKTFLHKSLLGENYIPSNASSRAAHDVAEALYCNGTTSLLEDESTIDKLPGAMPRSKQMVKQYLRSFSINRLQRSPVPKKSSRRVPLQAAIHASVLQRIENSTYRPANLSDDPRNLPEEIKNWFVSRNANSLIAECYSRPTLESLPSQPPEEAVELQNLANRLLDRDS